MDKKIDKGAFYLFKVDDESMIVFGRDLESALSYYKKNNKMIVWDVAKNYFYKEGAAIKKISYQQLFKEKAS